MLLFGTDQRITSGPAAKRSHSKAEYMTAPERFADSQIPLAPRAPSIHGTERRFRMSAILSLVECAPNGGHLAGMELTKAAGLSEDESHGQTTFP